MKILAVSSNTDALTALGGILERLFPGAQIVYMTDPLMAGKYAFHNRIDLLLAESEMKRMDGIQLVRFVRQEQPSVRAYLIGRERSAQDRRVPLPEDVAGCVTYPFSSGAVAAVLKPGFCAETAKAPEAEESGNTERGWLQ